MSSNMVYIQKVLSALDEGDSEQKLCAFAIAGRHVMMDLLGDHLTFGQLREELFKITNQLEVELLEEHLKRKLTHE